MFLNMGFPEVATILVAALLLLGPQKLPEFARWLGRMIREVRKTTQEVRDVINLEIEKEEIERLRKEFADHINVDPSLELEKAAQDWINEVESDADSDDHVDDRIAQELADAVENQQMYPTDEPMAEDENVIQPDWQASDQQEFDSSSVANAVENTEDPEVVLPVIAPPDGAVARGRSIHTTLEPEPSLEDNPTEAAESDASQEPVPEPVAKDSNTTSS